MNAALSPTSLIGTASAFSGVQDLSNGLIPGAFADLVRRQVGMRGRGRWDVAILYHWGYWSHYDHATNSSAWPLIPTAEAEELGAFAKTRDVLREQPVRGDVFLQYSPRRRSFVRGGVVAHVYDDRAPDVPYYDVMSLEGNSGDVGDLGGTRATRIVRRLSPKNGDRFVRWTDL